MDNHESQPQIATIDSVARTGRVRPAIRIGVIVLIVAIGAWLLFDYVPPRPLFCNHLTNRGILGTWKRSWPAIDSNGVALYADYDLNLAVVIVSNPPGVHGAARPISQLDRATLAGGTPYEMTMRAQSDVLIVYCHTNESTTTVALLPDSARYLYFEARDVSQSNSTILSVARRYVIPEDLARFDAACSE